MCGSSIEAASRVSRTHPHAYSQPQPAEAPWTQPADGVGASAHEKGTGLKLIELCDDLVHEAAVHKLRDP
jgi:hypothetical protein